MAPGDVAPQALHFQALVVAGLGGSRAQLPCWCSRRGSLCSHLAVSSRKAPAGQPRGLGGILPLSGNVSSNVRSEGKGGGALPGSPRPFAHWRPQLGAAVACVFQELPSLRGRVQVMEESRPALRGPPLLSVAAGPLQEGLEEDLPWCLSGSLAMASTKPLQP